MTANHWIENSRKIYAVFLKFYPREHRQEYGEAMRQLFTDQCRSAYQQKGALGIILLWLRTLPDLGYTTLLEHITSPRATWGLLEPVPNEPLPWKGVLLILLPGLVYLISQIAQLTGQAWYLTVYYRAAFFLIIPVLLVWALTRRFPLWGLIPLGLLYRLLQEIGYQLIVLHPGVFSSNPVLNTVLRLAQQIQKELLILVFASLIIGLFLAWRYTRLRKLTRWLYLWLGVYLALAGFEIAQSYISMLNYAVATPILFPSNEIALDWFNSTVKWSLYNATAFLLLVFIGTLFTRKHGFLAILILVGYWLPMLVIGIPWYLDLDSKPLALLIISAAVLAFRALLALFAPIWVARTGSETGQQRAVIISIVLAIGIHAGMQFFPWLVFPDFPYQPSVIATLTSEISLISGLCLGIALYRTQPFKPLKTPKLSNEKS